MPAHLRPLADKAGDALFEMPWVPEIDLEPSHRANTKGAFDAPYDNRPDKDRWWAMFFTMLGTRQAAVVGMFISQLQKLVPDKWDEAKGQWTGNIDDTRAMFGMIQSMKPRTVAEAALAAQLVALYLNNMKLAAGVSSYSMGDARTAATMARVTKAYCDGLLTLRKLQGKGSKSKQIIKVETHHHHHQHLHTGEGLEIGGRPQATDGGALVQCAALPSPDKARETVPIPSRARKARLPDARGKGRRPKGGG